MKVVIVTGKETRHKKLCIQINKQHQLIGIIHPAENKSRYHYKIIKLIKIIKDQGLSLGLLHLITKIPSHKRDKMRFTSEESISEYNNLPQNIIHNECDVNSPNTLKLLRSMSPDITICLGGPVYPKAFIECSPIMLNYHSGLSPIYNGTASTKFAFAYGHPHLCGGTLMQINQKVDGGNILGHYLPEIKEGDTPSLLFERIVSGAGIMYKNILNSLDKGQRSFSFIQQKRPLFYTKAYDFSLYHEKMIRLYIKTNHTKYFKREEKIIEYWRQPNNREAYEEFMRTINSLLWGLD